MSDGHATPDRMADLVDWLLAHVQKIAWRVADRIDAHWRKRTAQFEGRGLYVKGQIDHLDQNPLAAHVHRLMNQRLLKEFSFGYTVPTGGETKAKDGAYDLTEINLIEVGPTLKGLNPDTELLAWMTAAEYEALCLRWGVGYRVLRPRDWRALYEA